MAKVLVVDDERGLRITLRAFLEEDGHKVETAESYEQGKQVIENKIFDVGIFDIVLPGGSGVELLQSLRKISPKTKGILITGDPSVDTAAEAVRTGAFDYLRKPVSKDIISKIVKNAAQIKSLDDERERLELENQEYRKKLEELVDDRTRALNQSEQLYRMITENATDVIWTTDLKLIQTFVSPSVKKVFGFKPEDVIGTPLLDRLVPDSLKDIADKFNEQFDCDIRNIPAGKSFTLEIEQKCKDGSTLWTEATISILKDDRGEPIGLVGVTRDISERKQSERILEESQERLELALQGTEAGLWDWNIQTGKLYLNSYWITMLGYEEHELTKHYKTWLDLVHPDDMAKTQRLLQAHFSGESPSYESEFRMKTKSGDWKWVMGRGKVVEWDSEHKPLRMVGTHIDVNEHRVLEMELRESEEKYRNLVELASDGISIIQNGKVRYVNQRLAEMMKLEPKHIEGMVFTTFMPPGERDFIMKLHDLHMGGERNLGIYDTKLQSGNGGQIDVEINGSVILYEGSEAELVTIRDITSRKLAEKEIHRLHQFRESVIDNANVWLNVLDEDGRVLIWNKAAEKISGYKRSEVVGNNLVWQWLYPEQRKRNGIFEKAKNIISGNEMVEDFETIITTKAGRQVIVSWNSRSLMDEDGKSIGSIALGRDVTERRQAEKELRESQESLKATFSSMSDAVFVIDRQGILIKIHQPQDMPPLFKEDSQPLGKRFDTLLPENASLEYFKRMKNVAEKGKLEQIDYPWIIDGKERWFSARISRRVDASNKYDGVTIVLRDVTEKVKANHALSESETRLRGIVSSLHKSAIMVIDIDGNYISAWADEEFEEPSGITSENIAGKNISETMPPDVLPRMKEILRSVIKHGQSTREQFLFPTYDCGNIWYEAIFSPLKDEDGQIDSAVIIVQDITERKLAEESLKAREAFEKQIISISADFLNMTPDSYNEIINNSLASIGEFSNVDRSYLFMFNEDNSLMSNTHEWCAEDINSEIDNLQEIKTEELPWWINELNNNGMIHIPDLENIPDNAVKEKHDLKAQGIKSLIVVGIKYHQRLIGFLGFDAVKKLKMWSEESISLLQVVADLYANAIKRVENERNLQKSEALYRLLADNQSDLIWTLDSKLQYTYISPSIKELRGFTPEELIGKASFFDAVSPEDRGVLQDAIENEKRLQKLGQAEPRKEYRFELELMHKNGHKIWAESSVSALWNEQGKFQGILGVTRNIADRKAAEIKLRESEELYRTLVESAGETIANVDYDGNILFMNRVAAERRGKKQEEVIDKTMWDIFPKDLADMQQEHFRKVIETGNACEFELISPVRNGDEHHHFKVGVQPVRNSKGETTSVLVIAIDIEHFRQTQKELQESRASIQMLFNSIQEFFIITNTQGTVLHVNPYGLKRLAYKEHEASGRQFNSFMPSEYGKIVYNKFKDTSIGDIANMFIPLIDRNGQWIYTEARISKSTWRGQEVYFGICRDISDRIKFEEDLRESEENARLLLDEIPTASILLDSEGKLLGMNRRAEQRFAGTESQMKNKTAEDVFVPEFAKQRLDQLDSVRREGKTISFNETIEGVEFTNTITPIKDKNGEILRFAIFSYSKDEVNPDLSHLIK